MQNIFIDILPPWVETGLQPAFYDLESGTVLQQTARMYAKVRELTEGFNTFTTNVANEINRFETETNNEIERFEGVINDTVEEYIQKFNDLHDYVEDYFDNLDVQEEINNKLDKMVEAGTLQEIITSYIQSNVTWTFDNVESMISATNLVAGSFARTLGYYNKDDGGGATYKIVASSDADTNHFYETISDSLKAELQCNGVININALGADNTGTNDSSSVFNSAFAFINAQWLAGNYSINTVMCEGKYKWLSQVTMPLCARLRGKGYVTILTNVTGSALKLDYLSQQLPADFDGNKQDWQYAELINFDKGGLFKNIGTDLTNTCIEIGRDENLGNTYPYCRYKLCNFRIYNYSIGILHNKNNVFIGKYENISFETNATGVQFCASPTASTNSGENMTFINCLFASGTNGILWNTPGWDVSIINTSFDFLTNCFRKDASSGYSKISVTDSHFEGFTYIAKGFKQFDVISISQCTVMFQRNGDIFDDINVTQNGSYISFDNNKIMPIGSSTNPEHNLNILPINIVNTFNYVGNDSSWYGFRSANILNTFDNIADGSISVARNAEIGIWKVTDTSGSFNGTIVTDNYLYTGHKSLVLTTTVDTADKKNWTIQTKDFIPVNAMKGCLFGNVYKYNMQGGGSFTYSFYDENQQLISSTSGYHYLAGASTQNTWYMPLSGVRGYIPANAKYFKVTVSMSNINNSTADPIGTDYKLGGIIIN